ncbi:MAG: hypothetical protein A3D31_06895 [Candidatus Fluviicola riflensis]|nr:MAG: hypothetical protein CHH17_08115 [Candidatus Fluviicola riflensis]OGS79682.1 MAG: hypothetical protein A3D31_06895 [Candidatus Fluviicola riflensis]OGS87113.1 MAG: hypothetical protein A2724_06355 [Fluviicola sp. RIFCSPHIGHO2_01_FULL_43_53]OGS89902.1 MAG: hypothetical protein A3E30_03100 [Fluviicola sp. RIFCSPHIGHO2_12_FULL_43_24]
MKQFINSRIGRLRIIGFLEGISLLVLLFVAVPLKYMYGNPNLSALLGPIHGGIFVLFLFNTLSLGVEYNWKFKTTTWKIILACFIPFGTIYIDYSIFRKLADPE